VNASLDTPNLRKTFIGVLDIAGFEIFELNVLEQLLINYTNERLQQFFNHHMFVEEQEEYKREGIQWAFVDFGMDLIKTIELLEKKMGILSMLEEECIVPKATDKTYLEKLMGKHLGKNECFGKPKPPKKGAPEAHFQISHYAGVVSYNVTGWLFKNKDPVNDAVINLMQSATNPIVSLVFQDKGDGAKKKGSALMTISAAHRESLMKLMSNLNSTHPHFVRCIIPNEIKKSGHVDAPLVMHQLNCNGVLEGIRICMLGLPNKVPYNDFMARYSIVAPKTFSDLIEDPKNCATKALPSVGMDTDDFRCGHTKIMFRAGKLSNLEEIREKALSVIFGKMQCHGRNVIVQHTFAEKKAEKRAIASIQQNVRNYYRCKNWPWYQFYMVVVGESAKIRKKKEEAERRKLMAEGFHKLEEMLEGKIAERREVEGLNDSLKRRLDELKLESMVAEESNAELKAAFKKLEGDNAAAASHLAEAERTIANERLELEEELKRWKTDVVEEKKEKEQLLKDMRVRVDEAKGGHQALKNRTIATEAAKTGLQAEIRNIGEDVVRMDKKATQLLREKHELWQCISFNKQCKWMHERYTDRVTEI